MTDTRMKSENRTMGSMDRGPAFSAVLTLLVLTVGISSALGQTEKKKPVDQARPSPRESIFPPQDTGKTVIADGEQKTYQVGEEGPVIKAPEPVQDFGTVWAGPTLKHTFIIKNEGPKTLDILKVKTSCGCTVAGQYPRKLKPGESGEFPFSINSNKLRGRFEKTVTVSSNDPVTPSLKLKLRGVCNRYLDIMPTAANFGKLIGDEPQQRVLKITNNTDTPAVLTIDPEKVDNVEFKLVETEPGKKFELVVSVTPPYTPGLMNVSTTISTNLEKQKTVKVAVRAKVPDRLEVTPDSLTINVSKDTGRPFKRPIRFTNHGKTPVKLLSATVDDPAIKLTIKERTEGKAYTIYFEAPSGYKASPTPKTIVLKTDDPEKPEIRIPFRAYGSALARKNQPTQRRRPADELVGKKAPSFSVKTLKGKEVSNGTLGDAITVLDFFAPNCPHCKKQLPKIEALRKKYEAKGVRFVAVSQTMRKKYTDEQVAEVVAKTGFSGELATDPGNTVGPLFKATGFPTLALLGKSGKVEAVHVGNSADLEKQLTAELDALIAGKAIPKFAAKTAAPARKRPDALVGKPAPKFPAAKTVDGKDLSNESLKGSITVLDFFAANCPHCNKQLPRVEKIRQEYEAKGVRFVAVSQTMRGKKFSDADIKAKIQKANFAGELVTDPDNKIGPLFNATGFPTMAIVGKDGKIAAINVGNVGDLEKRMKGQLDALIAGKPVPSFASKTPTKRKRPALELVGKKAPAFAIKTLADKPLGDADFANHPATVLNFVAPNCGFCKRQLPNVEKVRQAYEAKGVRFVNIAQKMRKAYTTEETVKVFEGAGSKLELATDFTNTVGGLYKATSYPTMVVVDKNGKVAHVNIGAKKDLETILKGQLDTLIKAAGS